MKFPTDIPTTAHDDITVSAYRLVDTASLFAALDADGVWTHIPVTRPRTLEELNTRLTSVATQQPLVIRRHGTVIGTSSFHFDPTEPDGIEIGSTLLAPTVWGTGLNTTVKKVMLAAAFDAGAEWVQLRTDERNQRSAAAILKLPGVAEAEPRVEPQWVRPDGTVRTSRMFRIERPAPDYTRLPSGLPEPVDDGAAAHLPGMVLPSLALPSTAGGLVRLDALGSGRTVLYFYPMTGQPGVALPDGWDEIPGARGCSAQACDFRDHHADLRDAGVTGVYGVSSQDSDYQREVVDRLHLPFPMLSDADLKLADALGMPTFQAAGRPLYKRLTMIVSDGVIEHVFYPVFPPNEHAEKVLSWLRSR